MMATVTMAIISPPLHVGRWGGHPALTARLTGPPVLSSHLVRVLLVRILPGVITHRLPLSAPGLMVPALAALTVVPAMLVVVAVWMPLSSLVWHPGLIVVSSVSSLRVLVLWVRGVGVVPVATSWPTMRGVPHVMPPLVVRIHVVPRIGVSRVSHVSSGSPLSRCIGQSWDSTWVLSRRLWPMCSMLCLLLVLFNSLPDGTAYCAPRVLTPVVVAQHIPATHTVRPLALLLFA
jgi:hypothetical protein